MNVVMVSYMDLTGPGVMHLYHFANELRWRGHAVLVLLNGDLNSVELMEQPPLFDLERVRFTERDLEPSLVHKIKAFEPHLVHIWTPRNVPARVGLAVKYHTGARMLIHYEDDEDYLYDFNQGNVLGDLAFFVNTLRDPNTWNWKHPVVSFLANHFADAFTAICRPYLGRLERQWGKKVFLLYPGVDLNRFHPAAKPADLGDRLDLAGKEVVLYSGSIGAFHQFDLMLQAFARVAQRRPDAVLVHLGYNRIQQALDAQVRRLGLEERVHFLGAVPHRDVHRYLALADVLVQSGRPNTFNEFRLPAKLPEYMAMGKPVITFSAGIGRELVDGVDVLKTITGEPDELADRIEQVLADPALAERLGRGARRKAEQLFDWGRNTEGLIAAYEEVLGAGAQPLCGTSPLVKPRIRASVAVEAFGAWWETRGSRRVLVVSSAANGLTDRTRKLITALTSRGHLVDVAVPEGANLPPVVTGLTRLLTWSRDSLNWLVWQVDPEVLLFEHWSALTALDAFMRRPVVLDLGSGWCEVGRPPGDALRALVRADFLLCASEQQRAEFLSWADYYGLAIQADDVAPISLVLGTKLRNAGFSRPLNRLKAAFPDFRTENSLGEAEASRVGAFDVNAHLQAAIEPLDQFCRAPFVRRPPPLLTSDQKTFGMLVDEAIGHYRRGGMLAMLKETIGYFRRKWRG